MIDYTLASCRHSEYTSEHWPRAQPGKLRVPLPVPASLRPTSFSCGEGCWASPAGTLEWTGPRLPSHKGEELPFGKSRSHSAVLELVSTGKVRKLAWFLFKIQIWTGHSLCLSHVNSSHCSQDKDTSLMWPLRAPFCSPLTVPYLTCTHLFPLSTPATRMPFACPSPCHRALYLPCSQPGRLFPALCPVYSLSFRSQLKASFLRITSSGLSAAKPLTIGSQSTRSPSSHTHHSHTFTSTLTPAKVELIKNSQTWFITWLLSVLPPDCMTHKDKVHVRICSSSYPHRLTLCLPHSRYFKNV